MLEKMTPGPPLKIRAWLGGRVHGEIAAVCFRRSPLSLFFKRPRRFDKIHLRDEQEEDNWSPTQSHPLGTQQGDKMDLRTLQNMQRHNTDCLQVCAFCCEKTGAEQNFCILQVMRAQRLVSRQAISVLCISNILWAQLGTGAEANRGEAMFSR